MIGGVGIRSSFLSIQARARVVRWRRRRVLSPGSRALLENKATACDRLRTTIDLEESDSNERLRVSNWIVQRLYNDAVKETIEH